MLLLVRHAQAEHRWAGGPPEHERPLTMHGHRQAAELVGRLTAHEPNLVVSSPYRRAFDTVVPTARVLGLDVLARDDLREWDDGLEFVDDWMPHYERCWADAEHRYGAGETHQELGARAGTALRDLLERSGEGVVVAASHGTWIVRGLGALGVNVSLDFWRAMPSPAVYVLVAEGASLTATGPGLA